MSTDDLVRLRHMLDAAQEAIEFAKGRSREDLEAERMLNLSLVRLLEIIGEAARAISPSCCEAHQNIAWKKMVGMRDRMVHGYFDINLDIVWQTVTEDLPALIAQLEEIIPREETQ